MDLVNRGTKGSGANGGKNQSRAENARQKDAGKLMDLSPEELEEIDKLKSSTSISRVQPSLQGVLGCEKLPSLS
mgnify:CR=1 FL=1